jgi:DNA-binding NtrC family response regulator
MISGHATFADAVHATRLGAYDFFEKPIDRQRVLVSVRNALERAALRRELGRLRASLDDGLEMIGSSEVMKTLHAQIAKVAPTKGRVLIGGESGTGKELVAARLHALGRHPEGPFQALNCAALQDTLVEAELFGFERGAFTGAEAPKAGLVEAAERGTLFLDELGDLSLPAQAKLLRVLEEGTYRRLGSTQERQADIRLVAATNRPLPEAIEAGHFRQDLFFRLNILEIRMPPLRDHREDIRSLVEHFYAIRGRAAPPGALSPETLQTLAGYSWPGNVRELFNVLERVSILSGPGRFDRAVLDQYMRMTGNLGPAEPPDRLAELEMQHIHRMLDRCHGNKTHAARVLGISLKTLYNKLNREREDA